MGQGGDGSVTTHQCPATATTWRPGARHPPCAASLPRGLAYTMRGSLSLVMVIRCRERCRRRDAPTGGRWPIPRGERHIRRRHRLYGAEVPSPHGGHRSPSIGYQAAQPREAAGVGHTLAGRFGPARPLARLGEAQSVTRLDSVVDDSSAAGARHATRDEHTVGAYDDVDHPHLIRRWAIVRLDHR
jgi:hypothetical protein